MMSQTEEERVGAEEEGGIKVVVAAGAAYSITGRDNGKGDKKEAADANEENDRVNVVSCESLMWTRMMFR